MGQQLHLCPEKSQVLIRDNRIISIRKLPDNVENAMASVKAARYQIRIRKGYEVSIDFKTELPNFFAKENIVVEKQTKKSTKELDQIGRAHV